MMLYREWTPSSPGFSSEPGTFTPCCVPLWRNPRSEAVPRKGCGRIEFIDRSDRYILRDMRLFRVTSKQDPLCPW